MLQVKDLHFSIGNLYLLKGVNWIIKPEARMSLIGTNGSGKTTLLKILSGIISPDQGTIHKSKEFQIGYLPQEESLAGKGTVIQETLRGREDLLTLEKKIQHLQNQLDSKNDNQNILLKKLDQNQHLYESLGGYQLQKRAGSILSGLGFVVSDFNRALGEFSGGFRMRTYLARLLLQNPDLLLLDEPTNHLELPSLEWLEQYLLPFSGSMVIVSHDRFFIDRLAKEIFELENGSLTHYPGNYHFFEKQKEAEQIKLEEKRLQQLKEIKHQEQFINRFRAKNTKATQVQSRIKQLKKIELIEALPAKIHLNFKIPLEVTSYKHVLEINNVAFRYEQYWIFKSLQLDIFRGEKIALVGRNGAGKTTLIRLISGQLKPQEGRIILGERTQIGYYDQHQIDVLDKDASIYDEVTCAAALPSIPRIRDILGIFQFKGEEIYKKIKYLSGGEKARVSLVKILLSPVNFLIMDEPTNHLDSISKEALEKALWNYSGTLILISHDRYFLDKIINKVIQLEEGILEMYPGNYSYYLEKRETNKKTHLPASSNFSIKKGIDRKEKRRAEAQIRQTLSNDRNRLKQEIQTLEEKIDGLEIQKKNNEYQMTLPETYQTSQQIIQLQKEQSKIIKELPNLYKKWEKAQLGLEKILTQLPPPKK